MLMILVNNPGSWQAIFSPLRHARWHGCTLTDLVFPFFLFIVGVSIVLSLQKQIYTDQKRLVIKIIRRSLILIILGLLASGFPFFTLRPEPGLHERMETIRLPGVLQRIALCYFFAAVIFLNIRYRGRIMIIVTLLLGYWALMSGLAIPGCDNINSRDENLAACLDRYIFGVHLYKKNLFDPEGLLSTLPAVATTLLGVEAGEILSSRVRKNIRLIKLFFSGIILTILGLFWDIHFPINKQIWTSSYVLFTAGLALMLLAILNWICEEKHLHSWGLPFRVYGLNAITVFVLSGFLARLLKLIQISGHQGSMSLQKYIFITFFLPLGPPQFASFYYALCWITGWFIALLLMYRKRIIIKL